MGRILYSFLAFKAMDNKFLKAKNKLLDNYIIKKNKNKIQNNKLKGEILKSKIFKIFYLHKTYNCKNNENQIKYIILI